MPIQVTRIELIILAIATLLNNNFFKQLLNSDSVILDISRIQIPNNINKFIGSKKSIPVIVIKSKELFAVGLVELAVDTESLEDELKEIIEFVDGNGVRTVSVGLEEAVASDSVGLLA
jgi:hypothetical protein